ncbi:hypothetical protein FZT51_08795 [Campylobacter upsaliensis]|nr:hypothetical protein [Campylobacter upsaliensis]
MVSPLLAVYEARKSKKRLKDKMKFPLKTLRKAYNAFHHLLAKRGGRLEKPPYSPLKQGAGA